MDDGDLTGDAVAAALPGRAVRSYPALLSTEAEALAWARAGAPHGAVVVADYQASPRGRGGLPWEMRAGEGLGFSLVTRPDVDPAREGWPYVPTVCALADVAGTGASITWPDRVEVGGTPWAMTGIHVEVGPERIDWAVTTVFVPGARPPRAGQLSRLVAAIERRSREPAAAVLDGYLPRCATLGRRVRARLVPMGPAGLQVAGRADDVLADGALVIETDEDRRVAVPPQNLGMLEDN